MVIHFLPRFFHCSLLHLPGKVGRSKKDVELLLPQDRAEPLVATLSLSHFVPPHSRLALLGLSGKTKCSRRSVGTKCSNPFDSACQNSVLAPFADIRYFVDNTDKTPINGVAQRGQTSALSTGITYRIMPNLEISTLFRVREHGFTHAHTDEQDSRRHGRVPAQSPGHSEG